ncbi:hypothetical protein COX93_00620 [Candidatus Nomurabacteria bacterium CG_4_10_14_0_2_um_filter_30_12]|uniref:DUF2127 domain-containing protein n=2 Tax=Candidatus Nomuraibacteriota TaxID=1752729 RepID=A0A2J0MGF5_9BACT|nr:MAG: hypothetical protein COU48_00805 [Candidatus Nomurabacteria bacterium CG10_big_fil_rev_8_21_14_0_10_03_31_7]PIZ87556.1 MAG: hypothetical protein COX93_00620 [Candidatus Nomurabacteria bacterium CG_4_10_14_0_2_um_filter_30_12]
MNEEIVAEGVQTKSAPMPVKILAVLNYISAAITLVSGILMLFAENIVINFLGQFSPLLQGFSSLFLGIMGIFAVLSAVLNFFIGKGLWFGKNWARIFVIVISILAILGSLKSLIVEGDMYGFIYLAIYIAVGAYFLFNKSVKEFFKKV